uniref:Transmembrane protein n=1 Tax=Pithovirus LCPAC404 TaxID=2506597 RepID=A0A481ZCY6_9VIRU|nr:MAG: uncharacterized protein LCPAC404_00390 [Pithovirus LCPAC404]
MAALSIFNTIVLIIVGVLLIVSGALGVNLHNRCSNTNGDSTSQGEQVYFIVMIVVGIVVILIPPVMYAI